MKKLLFLPLPLAPLRIFAQDQPLTVFCGCPEFPGGHAALTAYFSEHAKCPDSATKDRLIGKVYVSLHIAENGKAENVKVVRSLSPDCDSVALTAVLAMPAWVNGLPNRPENQCHFSLPFRFECVSEQKPQTIKME